MNASYLICTKKGNKYGIINTQGIELFPPTFSEVELEQNNLSIIKVKKNGKYGFLNSEGELIIDINIISMEQVWAETIFIKVGKKWGVIDLDGNYKLPIEYDKLEYNSELNIITGTKGNKKSLFSDDGQPK